MRTLTGPAQTAVAASVVRVCHLVEIGFASGTVRVAPDVPHDVLWGGHVWTGAAHAVHVDVLRETVSGEATGLRLTLSGALTGYLSAALSEHVQGRPISLWVALFDAEWRVISDPVLEWSGLLDLLAISEGDESTAVSVTAESRYADRARSGSWRHSDADQQMRWPGDRFYSHASALVEAQIVWPSREWLLRHGG